MALHKLPLLEQRIRLKDELLQVHTAQASAAQTSEELVGDLVHATELNSQLFENNFPKLTSLYNLLLDLHGSGCVPLAYVNHLFTHLDSYILIEVENLRYRQHLLPLEAEYDALHDHHSTLASDIKLNLLTLLSVRDEVLLRAQGHPPLPPADLNLNLI